MKRAINFVLITVIIFISLRGFGIIHIPKHMNQLINAADADTLKIVTPVIYEKFNQKNPPSYIDPKKYLIRKHGYLYTAYLPGGTVIGTYKTLQEAQKEINEWAKNSRDRWIESGGHYF